MSIDRKDTIALGRVGVADANGAGQLPTSKAGFDSAVHPVLLPTTTELRYLIPAAGQGAVNLRDPKRFMQDGRDNVQPKVKP